MKVFNRILKVGLYDTFFSKDQESMTRYQKLPPNFKYVPECDDPDEVDVVFATQNSWPKIVNSKHPFKIYFPQETTEFHKTNINYCKVPYEKFKLVLTNDKRILYALPFYP
jgi:hypothetical protein